MLRPYARLRLPGGLEVPLYPGQLVGRMSAAAAQINDPRVSEAHAMLSLRGRRLLLIALRGLVVGPSGPVAELPLEAGLRIRLVEGVDLDVLEVYVPDAIPALVGDAVGTLELDAAVYAILEGERLVVQPGFVPGAAHLWQEGERWWFARPDEAPLVIHPGDALPTGDGTLRLLPLRLTVAGARATLRAGRIDPPIRLVLRHETAHLHREGQAPLVITGVPARILSELAAFAAPAPWDWVARAVWGAGIDAESLRRRWDRNLHALRAQLRRGGVLRELALADGRGNVELVMAPGDEVVDEG